MKLTLINKTDLSMLTAFSMAYKIFVKTDCPNGVYRFALKDKRYLVKAEQGKGELVLLILEDVA